ncbi:hypothetical protein [Ramlibacter sp. WS9]|uniref:hypothetical protein n=1 Tax=Ramlibacter sp. WS9 TaxID=1882741 RepID=UPI001305358E|nr:hypothetical protein [Ramlibacter sp. WS9]HSV35779.1 hypothetical protein [Ramlibacter sp.]
MAPQQAAAAGTGTGRAHVVVAVWLAATLVLSWLLNPVTIVDILPYCTTAR